MRRFLLWSRLESSPWMRTWRKRVTGRNLRQALPLTLILVMAAALRIYGLNWDDGHWLHPDERQIFFIVLNLDWPRSLAEALSPASPLNPGFFAYGSLPIYLLKVIAALVKPFWPTFQPMDELHLVARPLVALFDLGTVYLTYRLARVLWRKPHRRVEEPHSRARSAWVSSDPPPSDNGRLLALLSAAFVSLAVIHVQLARFYTADPLLAFFVMLTLYLAAGVVQGGGRRRQAAIRRQSALGIALGLALATKVSAAPLILVVFVACHTQSGAAGPQPPTRQALTIIRCMVLPLVVGGVVFIITQPYALIDWQTFLEHTFRESEIARGSHDVPYTIQYAGTLPLLYPIWQTALWGLALPVGMVAWAGFAVALIRWLRRAPWTDALLLAWAGSYLVITGLLYAKYLRYMLPLVPVLCLMAASLLTDLARHRRFGIRIWSFVLRPLSLVAVLLVLSSMVYALVFSSMYASPHSWVTASAWIYQNVPAGSNVAVEHWDVALPLPMEVEGEHQSPADYNAWNLPLYDEPDDASKWEALAADLSESDYLVLASRRLYGSIPRVPDRYPVATRYYDRLLAGDLGFELAGEFTRGPSWLNPRIPPLPDASPALFHPDESFVVYDHPRALVLRNAGRLSAEELLRRLGVR